MNSKEMVKLAYNALSDKKGEDIKIIDIQSVSVPTTLSLPMEATPIRFRPWLTMWRKSWAGRAASASRSRDIRTPIGSLWIIRM